MNSIDVRLINEDSSTSKGSRIHENSSEISIRIENICIIISFLILVIYYLCISLYYLQNRSRGYFPTLSETIVEYPLSSLFPFFFTLLCCFLFLTFFLYLEWGQIWKLFSSFFIKLCMILNLALFIAFILFLIITPSNHQTINHLLYLIWNLIIWMYFIANFFSISPYLKKANFIWRLLQIIILTLAFIAGEVVGPFTSETAASIESIAEILFYFCIIWALLLWRDELSSLKIEFVIFTEDSTSD